MRLNNGICFDFTQANILTPFSKCSFFYKTEELENRIKATYKNEGVIGFHLKDITPNKINKFWSVQIVINFGENYNCQHYYDGRVTNTLKSSKKSHLTYHGQQKNRNKISGEIHIKTNYKRVFSGQQDKLEAPLSNTSNINYYPLPVCRIELSDEIPSVSFEKGINNHFELYSSDCIYNVLEIHLSRKGFLEKLLSQEKSVPEILASLFANTSMHTFMIQETERRPGVCPQLNILQTSNYELIILAGNEIKRPKFDANYVHYFYTKDYYDNIVNRNVEFFGGSFAISKYREKKKSQNSKRIIDIINDKA